MIETGKKVKFHYTLKVEGDTVESSLGGAPLEYVHGKDPIIPGLQKGLAGHDEGDKCTIRVAPDEAYGQIDPEAIFEVPKEKLPRGEDVKLGARLVATREDGEQKHGMIRDIRPETVLIDFNHPLAGKKLEFDIEVLSVGLNL